MLLFFLTCLLSSAISAEQSKTATVLHRRPRASSGKSAHTKPAAATSTQEPFSYFLLATQTWCGGAWNIHGLWPQYAGAYNGTSPEYCEDVSYQEPTGSLLSSMYQNWNGGSCASGTNSNDLWRHEWEKHGSCVKQQLGTDEDAFFSMAISFFNKAVAANLLNNCSPDYDECDAACFDLQGNLMNCTFD